MKFFNFLLLASIFCFKSFGQKQYRVIFHDTTKYSLDSLKITSDSTTGNLSPELMKTVLEQLKADGITQSNDRVVTTYKDHTVIRIDRETMSGSVTFNNNESIFDSLLLKNDELYIEAPTMTGFSKTAVTTPKKIFQQTGGTKIILNHLCKEYLSTDGGCRIFVADDLPSSINPGVRVFNIKGAVLGFELTTDQSFLKSYAAKIQDQSR